MAQDVQTQQWMPSRQLSIPQQAEASKGAVALKTSPLQAAEMGKMLIGQWPHANPPNPGAYSLSIAKTLEKYPLGVVEECCDPTVGLASTREFIPTVAAVTEWCERRVKRHQGAIKHGELEAELRREEVVFTPDHRKTMLGRLRDLWKGLLKPVTQ